MLYIFLSRSSSPSNFLNELLLIIFTFIGNHPIWEAALGIHKRLIKTWLWLLIEKLINGHHIRHRLERHYIAIDKRNGKMAFCTKLYRYIWWIWSVFVTKTKRTIPFSVRLFGSEISHKPPVKPKTNKICQWNLKLVDNCGKNVCVQQYIGLIAH